VAQLERATSCLLEHGTVVSLGRVGDELLFTTRDLLACEHAIVEGAERRVGEGTGVLEPGIVEATLATASEPLTAEQTGAARALVATGDGVSVLQALAGTGKTRVLGALARCYRAAVYRVVGVAPTGRAARELASAAGAPASTIHRLLSELEREGSFASRTVMLFDEAGMAPTRPSALLLGQAERDGVKVIAAGDGGQRRVAGSRRSFEHSTVPSSAT
jgi:hypothetical protein